MNKHLALAYAFAGLAVAAALIAFVTTSSITPDPLEPAAEVPQVAAPDPRPGPASAPPEASTAIGAPVPAPEAAVEYVYVDEPARTGGRHEQDEDDDDDDREADDRGERGHHDDD